MMLQGLPIAALLFVCFRASPAAVGAARRSQRTHRTVGHDGARHVQRADAVGRGRVSRRFRRHRRRRRRQRYWRGPVLSRFDGACGARVAPQFASACTCAGGGRTIAYTVTLEPNDQPWLFALDLPGGPPRTSGVDDAGAAPTPESVPGASRATSSCSTRAPVTQPLRYTQRRCCATPIPPRRSSEARDNARMPRGQSAHARVRARAARARSRRRRVHRGGARALPQRAVRLHAGAAALRAGTGRPVPVRHAARLLRALRERVRRAAARRRHSRARRHRLPGRRDESATAAT